MGKLLKFIIGVIVVTVSFFGIFMTWGDVDWRAFLFILLGYSFGFGYGVSKFLEDK
ncbi:MAG: hypothetical protein AAB451_02405 [Patescibacteria group bacterium]